LIDPLPPKPAPLPIPDREQLERLNTLYDLTAPSSRRGVRYRLVDAVQQVVARFLPRQRAFNAVLVDYINQTVEMHDASTRIMDWVQDMVTYTIEENRRHQEALAAWERRSHSAVAALSGTHEELRASIGVLQQAVQTIKHEVTRLAAHGVPVGSRVATVAADAPASQLEAVDSYKYVGFEDQFRGSSDDIRRRVAEYLPIFEGTRDVLDVGCGRGEFLKLLREHGVSARGIDINAAMVEVCRQQALDVTEADALSYLRAQPDGSLGGLFAAQVVEHLEPRYLSGFLDTAFDKLRPGAPIVLETINPACWFAFFESYIRDITHVRPLHPDTLKYLLVASGFQRVDIRYRSPYPDHEKLQPIVANASLGDAVETLNANVERINRLLFTWLDYAAIGHRA
jgi:SAM-dependent methyltransferase